MLHVCNEKIKIWAIFYLIEGKYRFWCPFGFTGEFVMDLIEHWTLERSESLFNSGSYLRGLVIEFYLQVTPCRHDEGKVV